MTNESAQRFSGIAANYAGSPVHARGASLARLVDALELDASLRTLDVAAGAGHLARALAARAAVAVALDPAPGMLEQTRALAAERGLGNVSVVRGFAERLPFKDAAFGRAASRIAPHHFADIEASIAEMARVVAPGGLVGIADLCGDEDPELDAFNDALERLHDPTHVRSYTPSRWRALFAGAGLELVREEQVREMPRGVLLLSEWCRVTATPAGNLEPIARLCREAAPRVREAFEIREEGPDVRIGVRRVELIVGRKPRR